MTSVEELAAALQQLRQQVVSTQADNQVLRERLVTFEAQAALILPMVRVAWPLKFER